MAAADQRGPGPAADGLDLVADRADRLTVERRDRAAKAVKDIAPQQHCRAIGQITGVRRDHKLGEPHLRRSPSSGAHHGVAGMRGERRRLDGHPDMKRQRFQRRRQVCRVTGAPEPQGPPLRRVGWVASRGGPGVLSWPVRERVRLREPSGRRPSVRRALRDGEGQHGQKLSWLRPPASALGRSDAAKAV